MKNKKYGRISIVNEIGIEIQQQGYAKKNNYNSNPTNKLFNSEEITMAGKKAAIDECLGIPLEEQNIPNFGQFNEKEKEIFKRAYEDTKLKITKYQIIPEPFKEYYSESKKR